MGANTISADRYDSSTVPLTLAEFKLWALLYSSLSMKGGKHGKIGLLYSLANLDTLLYGPVGRLVLYL